MKHLLQLASLMGIAISLNCHAEEVPRTEKIDAGELTRTKKIKDVSVVKKVQPHMYDRFRATNRIPAVEATPPGTAAVTITNRVLATPDQPAQNQGQETSPHLIPAPSVNNSSPLIPPVQPLQHPAGFALGPDKWSINNTVKPSPAPDDTTARPQSIAPN